MKRSTDRILTTHVGSLARPVALLDIMKEKENGRPYDAAAFAREVTAAALYLCGPGSEGVNGQAIVIAGGEV